MNYEVIIPKPVQKQLKSFPDDVQTRLNEKILLLTDEPRPSGVKKLKGYANEYRLRVGDYRVRHLWYSSSCSLSRLCGDGANFS